MMNQSTDEQTTGTVGEGTPPSEPQAPVLPATRDSDAAEAPPPPSVAGKGPMDQTVPDVVTGSTPLTRRDD